jgi:hypothetical protein
MKLFAFILSFYILMLATLPCIDVPHDGSLQNTEFSQNNSGSHQNGDDLCSPFCTCYCCTSPLIFQDYSIKFDCFSSSELHPAGYSFSYLFSYSASIWQPPKIS